MVRSKLVCGIQWALFSFLFFSFLSFWGLIKMIITTVGVGYGQLYLKETLSHAVQFLAQLCVIIHTLFTLMYLLVA